MWQFLCDLFWPADRYSTDPCDDPLPHLHPIRLHDHLLRKRGIKHLECVIAAGPYRDVQLQTAIRALKFHRQTSAAKMIGTCMARSISGLLTTYDDQPILVPVPLHWTRRLLRGFNQSLLLAEEIHRHTGWPICDVLRRRRATGFQSHRPRGGRRAAVHNAFVCTDASCHHGVILVDDLCTSGSTLDACALALKKAKYKHISALVAALG